LVDFHSVEERERLSGPNLQAFFKMMEIWKVRDEDAKLLLGRMTATQGANLTKGLRNPLRLPTTGPSGSIKSPLIGR